MPSRVTKFLKFQKDEGGILPPDLAREYLGVSRQALHALAKRKKVHFITVKGVRYYGRDSLNDYKWIRAAKRAMEEEKNQDPFTS